MLLTAISEDLIGDRWLRIDCFEENRSAVFALLENYLTKEHTDCSIPLYFSAEPSKTLLKANKEIIICSKLMQTLLHFAICTIDNGFEITIGNYMEPHFYKHSSFLFAPSKTDVTIGVTGDITVISKMDIQFCPICGFVMSNSNDDKIICLNNNCLSNRLSENLFYCLLTPRKFTGKYTVRIKVYIIH